MKTFYSNDLYMINRELDIPEEGVEAEMLEFNMKHKRKGRLYKRKLNDMRQTTYYQFHYKKSYYSFYTTNTIDIWINGKQVKTEVMYKIIDGVDYECELIDGSWYLNGEKIIINSFISK